MAAIKDQFVINPPKWGDGGVDGVDDEGKRNFGYVHLGPFSGLANCQKSRGGEKRVAPQENAYPIARFY